MKSVLSLDDQLGLNVNVLTGDLLASEIRDLLIGRNGRGPALEVTALDVDIGFPFVAVEKLVRRRYVVSAGAVVIATAGEGKGKKSEGQRTNFHFSGR